MCPSCNRPLPPDAKDGLCPQCVAARMFESIFAEAATEEEATDQSKNDTKWIGPYKLIERLGEGGFGEVFKAKQIRPVKRIVALKILKAGMDTRQIIARFEAERQALALMEHPNIARVFDAGETTEGRPYFVMEYVPGEPITHFCEVHPQSLREVLLVFQQVCAAVHHAHLKGVIHRDLKPSNILVCCSDDSPVPMVKLIDFGIARAVSQVLTERTVITRLNHVLGTPEYMSPEQAFSGGMDVDVRSDVYSLGAVLYELLTGFTPYRRPTDQRLIGDAELLRRQREEDPQRPSTRITTSSEGSADQAKAQAKGWRERDHNIASRLSHELDWIALKALARDRDARYLSAGEMAADIEAYLNDRAICARPPSVLYQVRKIAQRHRGSALAVAAVLLSLLSATFFSLRMATQANRARQEAEVSQLRAEAAQQQTRMVYSTSDMSIADVLMNDNRPAEAMAYLARAARTDPTNSEAATRLVAALAYNNLPTLQRDSLKHPSTVTRMFVQGPYIVTRCENDQFFVWSQKHQAEPLRVLDCKQPTTMEISNDGSLFTAASSDQSLHCWELASGTKVLHIVSESALTEDNERITSLAFSSDRQQLIVCHSSGLLAAWSLRDSHLLWRIQLSPPSTGPVLAKSVAVCPDDSGRLAVAFNNGNVAILVGSSKAKPLYADPFPGSAMAPVTAMLWMPTRDRLIIGNNLGVLGVWNTATNALAGGIVAHRGHIHRLVASPLGNCFASVSYDHTARIWDAIKGRPVTEPLRHDDDLYDAAFSPDGRTLATASRDLTVRLWKVIAGSANAAKPLRHDRSATGVAFIGTGDTLVSASRDGLLRFWSVGEVVHWHDHSPRVAINSVSLNKPIVGKRFTLAGSQHSLAEDLHAQQMIHAMDGKPWYEFARGQPSQIAVSEDLRFIVAWNGASYRAWSRENANSLGDVRMVPGPIGHLALTANGKEVVITTALGFVMTCDLASGKLIASTWAYRSPIVTLATHGNEFALATGNDNTAKLYRLPNLQVIGEPIVHQGVIAHAVFSADGSKVVTGSLDNTSRVWSTRDAQPLTHSLAHQDFAYNTGIFAVFTPDGRQVITTGSNDLCVRIWDAATGHPLLTPLYLNAKVTSLAVSPDSRWLCTGDSRNFARVWALDSALPLMEVSVGGEIKHVGFNATGDQLLVIRSNGWPRLWALPRFSQALPEWFITYAETWQGLRFNANNVLESVPYEDFNNARKTAATPPPTTEPVLARWSRWLALDPDKRLGLP